MNDIKQIAAGENRRYDLIAGVNRGWRKAQMDLLARVGVIDASDDAAVASVVKDFRKFLMMARFRLLYQTELHGALHQRRPGVARGTGDHHDVGECMSRLEALLSAVETMKGAARRPALKSLYLRFSESMADDFKRMAEEEKIVNPLLEAIFTDEEMAAIEQRVIRQMPEQVVFHFVRIITPALDPEGREELIARMRRHLAADRFDVLMREVIRPALTEADLRRLDKVAA